MAIVAKSRPDIDMQNAVGTYEFSKIACSLFAAGGTLHACLDKHKLMQSLEQSQPVKSDDQVDETTGHKAIIIDGMAVVQFSDSFNQHIGRFVQTYDSVHIVFDHYNVLQETRNRRTTKASRAKSHICTDATPIRTSMKQFLASHQTKDSLTEYLAKRALEHYKQHETEL